MNNKELTEKLELFFNRSSVRKYTSKKIDNKVFHKIIEASLQTPTSSHIQAFTIINITNSLLRKQIYNICGDQKWILDSSHFIIMCADLNKICHLSKTNINDPNISQDAYLAALLDAALVGMTISMAAEVFQIGSVMIGSVRNNISKVAHLLQLPSGVMPLFGICFGYYEKRKKPKPRLTKNLFLSENSYSTPENSHQLLDEYHKKLQKYYEESPLEHAGLRAQKNKTWLEVVTLAIKNEKRSNMGEDLKNRGFNLSSKRS